ncbi:MAG TPA: HPr(Ser) kinase/phosphatase, partial [Verrucomicrobiae bacterium]|nr:HPr(Ser) kinase/phosphatase [Verrucomicrobiae bacterium]
MQRQSVTVERFFKEYAAALQMRLLADGRGLHRVIREPTVNRPGLALSGFTRYFAYKRVQVFGHAEVFYLRSLSPEERVARYASFFAYRIPCVVFSRGLKPDKEFLAAAAKASVPVFQTPMVTMNFINHATLELETLFAPRGTEIGSMVDILGVGVMIRGDSGIGKSEAVLALIERGYSLVSDDVTKVTLVGHDVMGSGSELTRNHMEIRGIGIINVAAMFGVKSVRKDKTLDLVVTLKSWDDVADVDRIGMEQEFVKILGAEIPHIVIPVRPGRDLARLIEVAAYQTKLKLSGQNAARELNDRLIAHMSQS